MQIQNIINSIQNNMVANLSEKEKKILSLANHYLKNEKIQSSLGDRNIKSLENILGRMVNVNGTVNFEPFIHDPELLVSAFLLKTEEDPVDKEALLTIFKRLEAVAENLTDRSLERVLSKRGFLEEKEVSFEFEEDEGRLIFVNRLGVKAKAPGLYVILHLNELNERAYSLSAPKNFARFFKDYIEKGTLPDVLKLSKEESKENREFFEMYLFKKEIQDHAFLLDELSFLEEKELKLLFGAALEIIRDMPLEKRVLFIESIKGMEPQDFKEAEEEGVSTFLKRQLNVYIEKKYSEELGDHSLFHYIPISEYPIDCIEKMKNLKNLPLEEKRKVMLLREFRTLDIEEWKKITPFFVRFNKNFSSFYDFEMFCETVSKIPKGELEKRIGEVGVRLEIAEKQEPHFIRECLKFIMTTPLDDLEERIKLLNSSRFDDPKDYLTLFIMNFFNKLKFNFSKSHIDYILHLNRQAYEILNEILKGYMVGKIFSQESSVFDMMTAFQGFQSEDIINISSQELNDIFDSVNNIKYHCNYDIAKEVLPFLSIIPEGYRKSVFKAALICFQETVDEESIRTLYRLLDAYTDFIETMITIPQEMRAEVIKEASFAKSKGEASEILNRRTWTPHFYFKSLF